MSKILKADNANNAGLLNKFISWIEFNGTCRALYALPENILNDIGVERSQIPQFVRNQKAANAANNNHAA